MLNLYKGLKEPLKNQWIVAKAGIDPKGDNHHIMIEPNVEVGEDVLVTRRGYMVPLGKGKEGIHDKFNEILNSSCDV